MNFKLKADFAPTGDQPQAIQQLSHGVRQGREHQTLLGVTGSGKTFTIANVIDQVQKPTLVIAHNKTLAAQLYQEFRDFFPDNAVSYFVSYYDYYQPEAYIPTTDTYIEKEAQINDEIDKLRLSATTNLLTRPDVIVVASVSCIYNLGSPVEYGQFIFEMIEGQVIPRKSLLLQLTELQYERSDLDLERGTFRVRGDTIQVWPAYQDTALKIQTLENKITQIDEIDPISATPIENLDQQQSIRDHKGRYVLYPAKHYLIDPQNQQQALAEIRHDLEQRLQTLKAAGKELEAFRLQKKVNYDLEMIEEFGFVNGIENYSRYFDGRDKGQPPYTLIDYFQENAKRFDQDSFLTIIDESHMTVPQIRGMFNGDRARKKTLVEHGFRLPSALDNRPLRFNEFLQKVKQNIYVSATPKDWEVEKTGGEEEVVEQLIRPTGLLDPKIELRPIRNQIQDLVIEIMNRVKRGERTLVTTLTKRMAEDLTDYLNDKDKIEQLVRDYGADEADGADRTQNTKNNATQSNQAKTANNYLPINQLPLGKIGRQYFTQAQSPDLGSKSNTDSSPKSGKQKIEKSRLTYPKVAYLHSEIETLERSDILDDLRKGQYDVVVGINLLREGLDLPEVSLVAILDADKAGFLRSETALIQTMGRAARHEQGLAILYANRLSAAMKSAIKETQRRRKIQQQFNQKHDITPSSIHKPIRKRLLEKKEESQASGERWGKTNSQTGSKTNSGSPKFQPTIIKVSKNEQIDLSQVNPQALTPQDKKRLLKKLKKRMRQAARNLNYELAAILRDKIRAIDS
jgi:excinuclease ABC subunit B